MFDITTLINDVILLGGFGGIVRWAVKNKGSILKVGEEIVQGAVALEKTSVGKVIEGELHLKLDAVTKQFRESEIGHLAAVALNYTAKDWGELSQVQKDALCLHLSTALPGEWNVSKADIEKAFEAVQKAADIVAGLPVIQSADKFTEEAKAIESKPVETATVA